jgi:succinate dehydrogenase/fumarate reductase flavoprotein subunit
VTEERICDVVVAGTGAAGFTAAITAKLLGLDVIMVEKDKVFGGTTALSGGIPWIPGNRYAAEAGAPGDPEAARTYLRNELGNRYDEVMIEAYLASGPEMVDFLTEAGAVQFKALAPYPDYHSEVEGATLGGRGLRPAIYDGRRLGSHFRDLKWPIAETMLFGRMMINGERMGDYFNVTRSARSFRYVAGRIMRYLSDRARGFPRATELASGNALIGRLAEKAIVLGIPILLRTPVTGLIRESGRIVGAGVMIDGKPGVIRARRGVVFATGGFSRDMARRAEHFLPNASGETGWTLTAPGVTGDAARLSDAAGGTINGDMAQPATWVPMSRVPQADGSRALFPHLADRNKPGMITVNRKGERFVNESISYQDFVPQILATLEMEERQEVYLIADHRAFRRYGLGPVRPHPVPFGKWLRNGYLVSAPTIERLAAKLDLDPARLAATVSRFNMHAAKGEDPDFHRGTTAYQRAMGDPTHTPNPSLGAVDQAPFYAVRLVPGDIGTSVGIRTSPDAEVLDGQDSPIAGLYAAGNDMANPTAGVYPGPGVTLGPAMTFGYRAARHLAAQGG